MIHFRQLHEVHSHAYAYMLADTGRREAVLIDPVPGQTTLYLALLDEIQSRLTHVLLTHAHQAGNAAAAELCQQTGAFLVAGARCAVEAVDRRVGDEDIVVFGDEVIRCRATPGHTAGCTTYLWRDRAFTGDALPIADAANANAGEDSDPGALFDSVTRKLLTLPDETLVYPAHDYAGRPVSCIGEQREADLQLKGRTRDEFIALQTDQQRSCAM